MLMGKENNAKLTQIAFLFHEIAIAGSELSGGAYAALS